MSKPSIISKQVSVEDGMDSKQPGMALWQWIAIGVGAVTLLLLCLWIGGCFSSRTSPKVKGGKQTDTRHDDIKAQDPDTRHVITAQDPLAAVDTRDSHDQVTGPATVREPANGPAGTKTIEEEDASGSGCISKWKSSIIKAVAVISGAYFLSSWFSPSSNVSGKPVVPIQPGCEQSTRGAPISGCDITPAEENPGTAYGTYGVYAACWYAGYKIYRWIESGGQPTGLPQAQPQPTQPLPEPPLGPVEQWRQFDSTDKGEYIELFNDNRIATTDDIQDFGTVRAGPWVARDGYATATVRVDRLHNDHGYLEIGVVDKGYTEWDGDGNSNRNFKPHFWFYNNQGIVVHGDGTTNSIKLPDLAAGSVVTVTLSGGTVTFANDESEVHSYESEFHSFDLPPDCGPISLAVHTSDAEVTLLDPSLQVQPTRPLPQAPPVEDPWSQFDGTHSSAGAARWRRRGVRRCIILSNDNKTATNDQRPSRMGNATIRTGWVDREGYATATVRVDRVNATLQIGVVTERYTAWDGPMYRSPHAWCYCGSASILHAGDLVQAGLPNIATGSVVTVTLDRGTVTWLARNGTELYSFELPSNCGHISLGVYLAGGAAVTLL